VGSTRPILARDLFDAVQTRLAANAVARQVRLKGSAAILTGRIFDDRGNRMSPTHANNGSAAHPSAKLEDLPARFVPTTLLC
jgi:hypothetical protein